jgi:hypothetical protein
MRFLALDLGHNLGHSRAQDRFAPRWGVEVLPSTPDEGQLGLALENFLRHQFEALPRPDHVALATSIIFGAQQAAAQRQLLGMAFLVKTLCARYRITFHEFPESQMRKAFLAPDTVPVGSDAIKKAVRERCKVLGWNCDSLDACDSLCVLDYLRAHILKGWPSAAERSGLFA